MNATPPRGLLELMRDHPRQAMMAGALAPAIGAVTAGAVAAAGEPAIGAIVGLAATLIALPGIVWGLTRGR